MIRPRFRREGAILENGCEVVVGKLSAGEQLPAKSMRVAAHPAHERIRYIDTRLPGAARVHDLAAGEVEALASGQGGFDIDRQVLGSMLLQQAPPLPLLPLSGLYRLASCDTAVLTPGSALRVHKDPHWLATRAAETGVAPLTGGAQGLLDGIVDALVRSGAAGARDPLLLLSSGKDSVGLFLGLLEIFGTGFRCLTFRGTADERESAFAADLCRRHGVAHEVLDVTSARPRAADVESFYRNAPLPTLDHVNLSYLAAHSAGATGSADLVDGLGNDAAFGYVPDAKERLKQRWSLAPWRRTLLGIQHTVGVPTKWFGHPFRGAAANMGMYNYFRWTELAVMGLEPGQASGYFERVARAAADDGAAYTDIKAFIHGPHLEAEAFARRTRNLAAVAGGYAYFPWCDETLALGIHALPAAQRYDLATGRNKLPLRELLASRLAYAEPKRGFGFDPLPFVRMNRNLMRDVIAATEPGRAAEASFLQRDWRRLERGPEPIAQYAAYRIQSLFQICAWLAFSRILRANRGA